MLFNSIEFLLFFPIVVLIYFVIPRRIRYIWLLIVSYYFYMSRDIKYVGCLLFSTGVTFVGGLLIEYKRKNICDQKSLQVKKSTERIIFIVCLILNFSTLAIFKYTDFFFENVTAICQTFHLQYSKPEIDLMLPVGISFFTFQSAGYLIDIYRGDISAERNVLKYALFVSFFPNILSGPIERAENLLSQINQCNKTELWNYNRITTGAVYMLWGYFLKMVIADRTALLVNTVYGDFRMHGTIALVTATVFFSIQIYCDFASYSYLALGTAKVLGFEITKNFDSPYLSKSISEFWRRWHISLSSWLRDYLYISLGGNRKGKYRKYVNTLIVFFVSGIWHGANWGYIIWGFLHGVGIVIGEITEPVRKKINMRLNVKTKVFSYNLLQTAGTFVFICFTWIFFKTEKISDALELIRRIFVKWDPWTLFDKTMYTWGLEEKNFHITIFLIAILFTTDYIRKKKKESLIVILNRQNIWFRWGVYLFLCCAIFVWGQYGAGHDPQAFLYFSY